MVWPIAAGLVLVNYVVAHGFMCGNEVDNISGDS